MLYRWTQKYNFSSGFKAFKASTCYILWSSIIFICFSNALQEGEYFETWIQKTLLILLLCFDQMVIFLHLHLSILPYDNADIFGDSLLILYCSFYHQLWWLVFMFFLKDSPWNVKNYLMQGVVQKTKKGFGFVVHF